MVGKNADYADVVEWRRDIHAHPELQFEVHRTAALVAAKLAEFGCDEVVTGIGKTGVVGTIHGQKRTSGKAIALRADMDALPIEEETGAAWASTTKGVMHACGHDGHTAMLLGAARSGPNPRVRRHRRCYLSAGGGRRRRWEGDGRRWPDGSLRSS